MRRIREKTGMTRRVDSQNFTDTGGADRRSVLRAEHLRLTFAQYERGLRVRQIEPIRDLSLELYQGEILAVIGSSGSGKSLLAHAIMGILPYNATVSGELYFRGEKLTERIRERVRGRELFLVPQSVTYLDPLLTVEKQIRISLERNPSRKKRYQSIEKLLGRYGLGPEVGRYYPHQLSGGMARKVLLACAMAADADVLIVDEPTPGLDEDSLQDVLDDFARLREEGKSVLMITHDINAALQIADRITVFYEGESVETAYPEDFRENGIRLKHPYSRKLVQALPGGKAPEEEGSVAGCLQQSLRLRAEGIHFHYGDGQEVLRGIDLEVRAGEVVGLIAPSGAGKTTLARILAGYRRPDRGRVVLERFDPALGSWTLEEEINSPEKKRRADASWCPVQMILQHPEKAVDPLRRMQALLEEAGGVPKELLEEAGIREEWLERWPQELSGGELQRFCLVRVLNERTRFLICDEMTTMLDAVSRAQLWELVLDYARKHRIGVIVISHDTLLVKQLCTRAVDLSGTGVSSLQLGPLSNTITPTI